MGFWVGSSNQTFFHQQQKNQDFPHVEHMENTLSGIPKKRDLETIDTSSRMPARPFTPPFLGGLGVVRLVDLVVGNWLVFHHSSQTKYKYCRLDVELLSSKDAICQGIRGE